ncbi:MAG: hypothetical protein JSS35_11760 [Proteobacteria bacterium]|nr:hypothetical protein [Pseudomonadota bacterium]
MKTLLMAGTLALAALTGCASSSAVIGSAPPTPAGGFTAADVLAVQKEANRHIETCDRTYAWPIAVTIVCKAQGAPPTTATVGLSAAELQAISDAVSSAVTKALAAQPAK